MDTFVSFFSYSYLKDEKEVSKLLENLTEKEKILERLSIHFNLNPNKLEGVWDECQSLSNLEFSVEYKGSNVKLLDIVEQIEEGDILTIGDRKRAIILEKYLERKYNKKISPSYFRRPLQMYIAGLN